MSTFLNSFDYLRQILNGLIADKHDYKIFIPNRKFGDLATNLALAAAKKEGKDPKKIYNSLLDKIKKQDAKGVFSEIIYLNGFINFKLSNSYLADCLDEINANKDYGSSSGDGKKRIMVEYFQNNVAKPPHIGHLRSAVVGDSLKRVYRYLGFKVLSDTHIGDWGTQFGILISAYKMYGDKEKVEKDPINILNDLYVKMNKSIERNPSLREKGKQEFAKLEKGDEENTKLWRWFVKLSKKDFERFRLKLGLEKFDYNLGESFYLPLLFDALGRLESKGLVRIGKDKEKYIDLEDEGLGRCILIKSDGASTYHLRDFATYFYRKEKLGLDSCLYVVDSRQSHHFRQLFAALKRAGYLAEERYTHVKIGFMSLKGGAISTRKGNTLSLEEVLNKGEEKAFKLISEKNPRLSHKKETARQVALAALKYFDLSHNRETEYVFDWDSALNFEGNSGPYLQYTYVRLRSILKKTGQETGASVLTDAELKIISELQKFPAAVAAVIEDNLPTLLCDYLYGLAKEVNSYYHRHSVLAQKDEKRKAGMIRTVRAASRVIKNGLYLLGIEALEQM